MSHPDAEAAEPDQPDQPVEPPTYTIGQFPETLAVVRMGPGTEIPAWAESSSVFSVIATATETSIVCAGRNVPNKAPAYRGYTGFAVEGTLEPHLVGVLVSLLRPLAEAGVSVFTLSTFDTEWILVPQQDADKAAEAWRRQGHTVAPASSTPRRS